MASKFWKEKGFFVVLACFIIFSLSNCEIGLGNSVDTQPPSISITSPSKGAIIKNTFTMEGVATDETYINSVSVTLTSNADKKIYGPFTAQVDKEKGTWKAVINDFADGKFKIPDGEYGVTVTAKDSASRVQTAESLYQIDNTPPLVVIKRPGLDDTFGRTVKITGDISDQSTLKALYFTPYRKEADGSLTKLCEPQVFANISGVGLELTVGKFFADTSEAGYDKTLDQVYKAIYDSSKAGTQDVFCVIEVEDSALEYNPPDGRNALATNDNHTGNVSCEYYLYDEIYSQIYSASGYGLSNNDLVKILNDSYEDSALAKQVKEYLDNQKLDSTKPDAQSISKFSLNPENSPTYTVSGYEVENDVYPGIFNESKIAVSVSPGRDQISLDTDTIRIYLVPEQNSQEKMVIFESIDNINAEVDSTKKEAMQIQRNSAVVENSEQFRVTTSIGNLLANKKYNVVVEGRDFEGNYVEPDFGCVFGFVIQSNNKPPVLAITSGTEDLSVQNNIDLNYSGTVESTAETVNLSYVVSAKNEKTGQSLGQTQAVPCVLNRMSDTTYSWSFSVFEQDISSLIPNEDGFYLYTVTIIAQNTGDEQTVETSRRAYLDTSAPVVTISSISPQVAANGKENNVNGIITINGTVSDNYTLKNTAYNLYLGESTTPSVQEKGNFGESTTFSFSIDTTQHTDKSDLKIELVSTDSAGNKSAAASKTVFIDQSTDNPVISLTNADIGVKEKDGVNVNTNLFDQTGNNKILGTASDDDSIASIKAEYSLDDGANWTEFHSKSNINSSTNSLNMPLQKSINDTTSLEENVYKIRLTANDTNGKETQEEFYIGVDANAPIISITTQQDAFQSSNVTVNGSTTDGSGISSFVRMAETAGGTNTNVQVEPGTGAWQDTFQAGDVGKTITYKATDVYGRTTMANFSYKVDTIKPTMQITSVTSGSDVYIGTTLSSLKSFSGTANDGTGTDASGVLKIQYSLDRITWQDAIGTTQWNANIDFSGITSDTATLIFKAIDNAGNESETKTVNAILDKAAPVLNNISVGNAQADGGIYYVNSANAVIISGTVLEDNLDSLTIDGAKVEPQQGGSFSATKTIASGSNTCTIIATDKAGQVVQNTITLYCDTTPPVPQFTSVSPLVSANGKDNNVNGTITITGTASDDDKVAQSVIAISTSDDLDGTYTDCTNTEGALTQESNDGMRFTYKVDTIKLQDEKFLKLTVTTKDRAGNTGISENIVYIDQSTDLPVVSFSNLDLQAQASENLFGMGSWTIYGTATDDDGLEKIEYKLDGAANTTTLFDSAALAGTTSKSINYVIPQALAGGDHTLQFILTDINGKQTEQTVNFAVDNDSPIIRITEPTGEFVGQESTAKGTVSDSNGITSVEFVSLTKTKNGGTTTIDSFAADPSITLNDTKTEWTCTVELEGADVDDTATYTQIYRTTDVYGRSSTASFSYKIDNIHPVLDEIKVSDGIKTVTFPLAEDAEPVWFAQSALTLGGSIEENNLASITMDYMTDESDSSTRQERVVTPVNNFSITESFGFEGSRLVSFDVKDKAGNGDTLRISSLSIDTVPPVVYNYELSINGMTTKTDSATATFDVTEETSGIAGYYIGTSSGFDKNENILGDVTTSGQTGKFTGTIDLSGLPEGSNNLYLRVVDKAGNASTDVLLGSFVRDVTAPVVQYSYPSENATVNKTIAINGSVSDANSMNGILPTLYVRDKDGNWQTIGTQGTDVEMQGLSFEEVSGGLWQINGIDTTVFTNDVNASHDTNSTLDGTQLILQVRFSDLAGNPINETGKTLVITADQNADRPVIKLNNIKTDGTTTLRSLELLGSATDDDGINNMYIQLVKDGESFVDTDESWTKLSLDSGNWTHAFSGDDGAYTAYFKVVDTDGTTFIMDGTSQDSLSKPYLQYLSNEKIHEAVAFKLDTNPPTISELEVSYDNGVNYESVVNNMVFGGTKRDLVFRVTADDTVSSKDSLKVKMNFSSEIQMNYESSQDKFLCNVAADLLASDSYTISVTAQDNSGMTGQFSRVVKVDNGQPNSISNVVPASTTEVTGEVIVNGFVADEQMGNSGISTMQYALPPANVQVPTDSGLLWQDMTSFYTTSWSITLGNLGDYVGSNATTELKDKYSGYETATNSGIYLLPIWFKVTDNAGNTGYITDKANVRYNPDGDKPRVSITYPMADQTGEDYNYVIMGGTIRITGSAEDNEGVDSVWLQFDMDGDGIFENGASAQGNSLVTEEIPVLKEQGAKATGTVSWSYAVNVSNLAGVNYAEDKKTMGVRVMAVDNDNSTETSQLAGAWSQTLHISVNNNVPQFNNLALKRFDGDPATGTVVAERAYEPDMYIKGSDWYLCGTVQDNDGIANVDVSGSSTDTLYTNNSTANTSYEMQIPVRRNDNGSGAWKVTISAKDLDTAGTKDASLDISINIDNTAPAFDGNTANDLVIYKDAYGSDGTVLGTGNPVQNSNGYFTLAGKVSEDGSGFERMVFYFKRTGSGGERIYNVMESHGEDRTANRTDISSSQTDGSVYINDDNLPVLKLTVSRPSDGSNAPTDNLEYTDIGSNTNVRPGGLVKIGGVYRLISGVQANSVTFTPACSTEFTEAEFVYGMVVDNAGESLNTNGTVKNDDYDGMVESYRKSGTDYFWDASVKSDNIPDGPVELHCVVFDLAGNSRHGYVESNVSNNAPRITSVQLGTDLNGNGAYDVSEYNTFYVNLNTDGTGNTQYGTDIWNLDTSAYTDANTSGGSVWTAKDGLSVVPEFVGGTAPMNYIFSKSTGPAQANLEAPETGATATAGNAINLDNDAIGTAGEDEVNTYRFSFWDSTEETTPGTDSQWTVLNAKFMQNLTDGIAPTAEIKPLYWNNASDNSLYENSRENGHIELSDDLPGETFADNGNGVYDKDDKVSGKITFTGTAYDDVRLNSIWISYDGFTFANYVTNATYGTNGTNGNYRQVAYFNTEQSTWVVPNATMENDGWEFSLSTDPAIDEEVYFDQRGHLVKWSLSIDTAKIATVAKEDVNLNIMAVAHNHTQNNSSVTTEKKMDVVPYITGVETWLSSLESSNPSVYNRTALGHYSMNESETIKIYGFNLDTGSLVDETGSSVDIGTHNTLTSDSYYGKAGNAYYSVAIPTLKSGKAKVVVNSLDSINNFNNNEAKGSYARTDESETGDADIRENHYNRMPNGTNNNLLTDDIVLDIWEIDSEAALPKNTTAREVVMKISPATGMIQFAFANGSLHFSMGGGGSNYFNDTTSHDYWCSSYEEFSSVGFAIDDLGFTYGVAAGGDTNADSADHFCLFTSRWGDPNNMRAQRGSMNGEKALRMEQIGQRNNGTFEPFRKRIKSPSLATSVHGNETSVYLAYYDAMNKEIRFKSGTTNSTNKTNFGLFTDRFNPGGGNSTPEEYTNYHVNIVASNSTAASTNGYEAREYVSIAVIPGATAQQDVVVLVWYDGSGVYYTYNTNPLGVAGGTYSYPDNGWAHPSKIFDNGVGRHCKIATDKNGGVHVVAYDSRNSDVEYAYATSYTGGWTTYTVDSYGNIGSELSIDVAMDSSGNPIPYISYYANASGTPKIAYLLDSTSLDSGSKSDKFTGKWEISFLPTESDVLEDNINVGLWKNGTTGEVVESVTKDATAWTNWQNNYGTATGFSTQGLSNAANRAQNNIDGSGYGQAAYGYKFANGTSNPMLAYQVGDESESSIETAQMK